MRQSSPSAARRRPVRAWRVAAALGAVLALGLVEATSASAYWSSGGVGAGASQTGTLAPPTAVTVAATGPSPVAVSWTASAGPTVPTGYYVTRTSGAGTVAACGTSPAAPVTGTSCNDAGVLDGAYTYRVTAVYRSWLAPSAPSGTRTVANATKLAFTTAPSTVASGAAITPAVAVTLQNAAGATVATAGISVSLAISTNPAGGVLSGTTTALTNSSGVATFANLSIDKAGVGYQLTAASPGLTAAVSSAFTVTAAAVRLAFSLSPTASFAGRAFHDQPVVRVVDAGGNTVTASTATVSLTLTTPAGATLTCAPKAAVAGIATFTGCSVNNVGAYTLTASSGVLATGVSASFTVQAAPTRLAWNGESSTVCTSVSGTSFARVYGNCLFILVSGTFNAQVVMTDTAGTPMVNIGPAVTVALTTPTGSTSPTTLTIAHGATISSASTTYSPGLVAILVTSGTLTASVSGLTSATARLNS